MFLIEKTAALLIAPLGFSLLVGLFALLLAMKGWRRGATFFGVVALVWLYIWSTPWASERLMASLEHQYPPVPMADLVSAPVAVVLGGGISAPKLPHRLAPDLNDASDRAWYAARLYRAGKVKSILLSGGVDSRLGGLAEAESMAIFLRDLGVPKSALILEKASLNTRQNAAQVKETLEKQGIDHILLVTSAVHMRRAIGHFAEQGLRVTPAATDHRAVDTTWDVRKLLPDSGSLADSGSA
ncbi:YdcF family protein, partial [Solemya elarraichensis gill symbiont]